MSLLDYFKTNKKPSTAVTAKERLQIIVAHQRGERDAPDYFPKMKQEIIEVIRKYVQVGPDQVSVQLEQNDENLSVLELNVTLPEKN
ncbi:MULTISPECIES: cell division topological specificity factor MinE [Shewanella]|uniref:Cell division topological specificity factor n=1 Tax=Shewanella fidelis TaxID=173509 RepID=A0AAW8NPK5_9GAMM|nr:MULTISPECIES: cell division topological specificity factor MinE [Shewanella]MDR8524111.1 cell division topological specificity factor MinE [Shewanella fidelis]MDW4810658.1 cell division topological specificity factor MinE [Shewanella fidelis]MDW4814779.1 cell division topological specificity factor MinE [Shewanella fidelis]MDW4818869.1 cell division topological specificity factor MinE [Shewanella fidelis]MDW4823454.1 cell division topological specificity factor MinE [Shewanella fidelis]